MMNKQRLERMDKKLDMIINFIDHPITVIHEEDFDAGKQYGGIVIIRPKGKGKNKPGQEEIIK